MQNGTALSPYWNDPNKNFWTNTAAGLTPNSPSVPHAGGQQGQFGLPAPSYAAGNLVNQLPGGNEGFNLFSKDGFNAVTGLMGGVGNLAQGWAAIKSLGLAEDNLEFQRGAFDKNYAASRTAVNNRIQDQNAWKTAQGRTDLAKLIA